jgi:hypothetical protein
MDRSYSRTRSRERVSRQPESEKPRKKSTRRYSKSRSPNRKRGARSQADARPTKANDSSVGRGGEFEDNIRSYSPPPTNPFTSGGMPSCESIRSRQQSLNGVDGQYPPTQFSDTACKSFNGAGPSLISTDGQYPTPSVLNTAGAPTAACESCADAPNMSDQHR